MAQGCTVALGGQGEGEGQGEGVVLEHPFYVYQ